ncbi:MAG: hypothetical protein ACW99J_19180 [Candidatus Thorarchaeota archaeon]|jgi:hypothetical protein
MAWSHEGYGETWERHDGKLVTLDGLCCKIRVSSYMARYPVEQRVISVHAEPTRAAKRSEAYRRVRRELRDDWSTDILDSDITVQAKILAQLGE